MPALPTSVEDVTPRWLDEVLSVSGVVAAGDQVTSVSLQPIGVGTALMSELHRVTYRTAGGAEGSVVVKLSLDNELRSTADELGLYCREIDFYRDLRASVPLPTPRVHLAMQAATSTNFVLVLEDLGELTPGDQLAGLDAGATLAAVDAIARMHASAWEDHQHLAELCDRFRPIRNETTRAMYPAYFEAGWANYLGHARRQPGEVLRAAAGRWVEALPWLLDELASPATLCHGDYRADNLFFAADGSVVVIDFQLLHQACGISDVAYLVSQSVEGATSDDHEMLVRRYCAALAAAGVDYPWTEAWRQYRIAVLFHLVIAVVATLPWPSLGPRGRDLVLRMVERTELALEVTGPLSLLPT